MPREVETKQSTLSLQSDKKKHFKEKTSSRFTYAKCEKQVPDLAMQNVAKQQSTLAIWGSSLVGIVKRHVVSYSSGSCLTCMCSINSISLRV